MLYVPLGTPLIVYLPVLFVKVLRDVPSKTTYAAPIYSPETESETLPVIMPANAKPDNIKIIMAVFLIITKS